MRSEAHTESAGPKVGCRETLGACRRNAPTPNLGGTKRIGRIEIVDPEPDARSHSSSQCRQTHYSDTLLARNVAPTPDPLTLPSPPLGERDPIEGSSPAPGRNGSSFHPSPPSGERAG